MRSDHLWIGRWGGRFKLGVRINWVLAFFVVWFTVSSDWGFWSRQVPLHEHLTDGRDNLLGALMIAGHCLIPEVSHVHSNMHGTEKEGGVGGKGWGTLA